MSDAVVVAHELRPGDRQLVAYVVARESDPTRLRAALRRSLPAAVVPAVFVMLETLPRTTTGKVDRAALPRHSQPPAQVSAESVPASDVERKLAEIFAELLAIPVVPVDGDFFEARRPFAPRGAPRRCDRARVRREGSAGYSSAARSRRSRAIQDANTDAPPIEAPVATHALRLRAFPSQRTAWRFTRMDPDGEFLHITLSLRFAGTIKPALMQRARRAGAAPFCPAHDVKRSSGELFMAVQPAEPPLVPVLAVYDLSRSNRSETDRLLAEATTPLRRARFDLERGPVMSAAIAHMPHDGDVAMLVIHHIAFDAGSSTPLLDDLIDLYTAWDEDPARTADDILGPARCLLHRFAAHMGGEASPDGQRQLAYWKQRLHGAQPPRLPIDPAPPNAAEPNDPWTRAAEVTKLVVPAEDGVLLHAFAHDHGASSFMTLLAAFAAYMRLTTDQSDLCLHSTYAQRHRRELERVVGLVGNPLLFRIDTSGDPTFRDLVGRVRDLVLEGYQHGEVPIINHLPPEYVRINVNYVGVARHATSVTVARCELVHSVERLRAALHDVLRPHPVAQRSRRRPHLPRASVRSRAAAATTAETFCAATRTRSPA